MDLTTEYLGLELQNPLVVSACQPLTKTVEDVQRAADNDAGAVVLYSLFEEQIDRMGPGVEQYLEEGGGSSSGSSSNGDPDFNAGPDEYLELVANCNQRVDVPVIASLNGASLGGWTRYAEFIEEAGADALELNVFYLPTSVDEHPRQIESRYEDVVRDVREAVNIPLAVKLGPNFTSIPNTCNQLAELGADAFVLFNRFYQPEINLEDQEIKPNIQLSDSSDLRLPVRWVSILANQIEADFAVTSGVHTYRDVIKSILVGGRVVEMASELLENGLERLTDIQRNLKNWMMEEEVESIQELQGTMSQEAQGPSDDLRGDYQQVVHSWRHYTTDEHYTVPWSYGC